MLLNTRIGMAALAALVLSGPAVAQADPATPTPALPESNFTITPSNPEQSFDPTTFQLTGQLVPIGKGLDDRMTMPVHIGQSGAYDFVIDTGSQRTIVAKELAQRLALPELAPVEIVSMAGRVTVSSVMLGGLKFGDHDIENLEALSIAHADMGGAGIIGLDSLKGKRLTLDFKQRKLEVGKSRRSATQSDANTIVVEARSKYGQLILVNSRVDGRRVSVILDTGAEMSVGNMALFNSLKVKKLVVPPQPTVLTSVTGIQVPALFTVVRRITIGTVTLDNVPMVFLDAAPFEELDLGDTPAMLLGMRMLRLFDQVAIDFGNRHVDFHIRDSAMSASASRLASLDTARTGQR